METATEVERGNGIGLGYKGIHASIRGPLAIIAVLVGLIGGASAYVTYKGFERNDRGHDAIIVGLEQMRDSQDLLSCVVALSPEERTALRRTGTREGFAVACPWLRLR